MLAKKQIEQAGLKHCQENNGNALELLGFIAGAKWAADQIEAEKKDAARLMADAAEKINQLVLENNRLSAALARLTEHIAELQKTLEK